MNDLFTLRSLGIIVVAGAVSVLAMRFVRMPSIVAYILAGLALGPVLGILEVTEGIDTISNVGVVLLLFLVGMELSLAKLKDTGGVAVAAGLGQVVQTLVGGFAISYLLGFDFIESLFLGAAISFSSTVVPVKLLTQMGEMDSPHGRIAVGIFLVQDLLVIASLTFLTGLESAGGNLDIASVGRGLLEAFAGLGLLVALALVAATYVLPRLFGWIAGSLEALFIWSLGWCFLLVVGAEALRLNVEIGAFIAGLGLAQLPYSQELRRRVHPLMNFFIAIFFISLGIRMDVAAALEHWLPALLLSLLVVVGNIIVFLYVITRFGYGDRTAFLCAVTVAQISEFSLIFAALGATNGLIDSEIVAIVAMIALVTIAVSAYLILYSKRLYEVLKDGPLMRPFRSEPSRTGKDEEQKPTSHVVVVGINALGRRLVEELTTRGERVLAIDTDPAKLEGLECETLLGNVDHESVLEEANVGGAKLVISALQIQDTNNLLAFRCRELGVPCSIHAFDRSVVDELRRIGVNHLMVPKNNGIKRVLDELRARGIVQG